MRQIHALKVRFMLDPTDRYQRFPEIGLRVSRRMAQRGFESHFIGPYNKSARTA
jgi:hypothetical protein